MEKHQLKGLCYNCDEKYSPRHKYKEYKVFVAISKDISNDEVDGGCNIPNFDPRNSNIYVYMMKSQTM
jgi:hypothetical protein